MLDVPLPAGFIGPLQVVPEGFPGRRPRAERGERLAEGVGFEPTNGLPRLLISSQVHSTTLPPFLPVSVTDASQATATRIAPD